MAVVTYIGRAGSVRLSDETVLVRQIPAELPDSFARGLSPLEYEVVIPVRRAPSRRTKPAKPAAATKPAKASTTPPAAEGESIHG